MSTMLGAKRTLRLAAACLVIASAATGGTMAFASAAPAATYITYCSGVFRTGGQLCTNPPGWANDPCDPGYFHSWGGWTENYFDTYQQGTTPTGEGFTQVYTTGCSGLDVCYFYSPVLHHMNDGGCTTGWSWNVGKDADLIVGIRSSPYSWQIYGTGEFP